MNLFSVAARQTPQQPVVRRRFPPAGGGPFSSPYTAGTVGMGVLAPFKMVLDYPHKRIAFIKQGKG